MLYTDEMVIDILNSHLGKIDIDEETINKLISKFKLEKTTQVKKEKINYYKKKIGATIPFGVHSYGDDTSILGMSLGVYEDYSIMNHGYLFKDRGCINRKNIMFEKKDIKTYVNSEIEQWIRRFSNLSLCENIAKAKDKSVVMNIHYSESGIYINPYIIHKYTLKQPYYITRYSYNSIQRIYYYLNKSDVKKLADFKIDKTYSGFFAFNKRDIGKIIKIVESFFEEYLSEGRR